ncbi:MAG: EAL domain-containing protein [Rhizobiaceae bacterium]|nr:EAL domain-containing protein [Rhizobiaceae bacterium]MCO5070957.1 EAL domain-containing protein [Rhizobiaceae bacterium]
MTDSGQAMNPTVTKQPAEAAPRHRLADILEQAGFGIEVCTDGQLVYSNLAQASPLIDRPRSTAFNVERDGVSYDISLTVDASEQEQREHELIQRAYFDDLTGLPNRALLERSVNALIELGETFGLAFIDLDGFKEVNDYFGHDIGDALLARLAERLSRSLRSTDMLARLSGDEFVLLVSPAEAAPELEGRIQEVSRLIKSPFVLSGFEVLASASIGVSLYPAHGRNYSELRDSADRAMYRGKSNGKGTIQFFDKTIEHAVAERTRLEQRVRRAIRDKRVCCVYQPKVVLRTGEVTGVEVLMRWMDEDGIIHAPGDFLALASELGLMDDLTHSIVAETIASVDLINEAFGGTISISINVTATQAGDPTFMKSLVDALIASGYPERFIVEVTEEAFLSKSVFQERILPMIRASGARVSIDDFGVGYSSLSALADITADEVKIDRSFVTDIHKRPRSQYVLKAIEALSHSLGISVVVEGVETVEELAYLQGATRVAYAQGYYFSEPVHLTEFTRKSVVETATRSVEHARGVKAGRG